MAKILIVDDRPMNREFLVTLLGYGGHRMLEAGDGAEALDRVRAEHPDLVIADVLMPIMDGYEFVRQLRADPCIAQSRVIFHTAAYLESEVRALAKACGVQHVIIVPTPPEEILQTVNATLSATEPISAPAQGVDFSREHLRLLTDKLAQQVNKLEREIAERKKAEELLKKQAQELTRSNRDLEQFAYAASHDLQEPLRAVAGCLQILQGRYQSRLDADADKLILLAVDGAQRLQALIEGLLAYSRVGTRGKQLQPVDCEKVVSDALKNLSIAIEESGTVVTHDALPPVMGDLTQLTQLFQNLIANAIKFRKKEQPPHIHVGAESDSNLWILSVRDNGIGIAPQYFDRIFEVFQRLHTRQEYPGTGIGLSICKKIVERHGGHIWLESVPQQGTTFFFGLPRTEDLP